MARVVSTRPAPDATGRRTFREIEWRSPNLTCPECGTCAIGVSLRRDQSDWGYVAAASCASCGKQFHADALPTYEERFNEAREEAASAPCIICGKDNLELRAQCERHAHRCFMLTFCPACGDVQLV